MRSSAVLGSSAKASVDHALADQFRGDLVVSNVVGTAFSASVADRIERTTGQRPIVGAVEGAHGDIAPALLPGGSGFVECRRIGSGIGQAAASLYDRLEADLTGEVELAAGLRELDVVETDRTIDGVELAPAAVGAALVAGALENVTPVIHRIPPFRAGSVRPFAARAPHGRKVVLGGALQQRVVPAGDFPRFLPVQVLRLGSTLLVGFPFELTKEFIRRVPFVWPNLNIVTPYGGTPVFEEILSQGRLIAAMPLALYCSPYLTHALRHYDPIEFYDRVRAICEVQVQRLRPTGARYDRAAAAAAYRRMVRNLEFDVCELAPTTYVIARAFGAPFIAAFMPEAQRLAGEIDPQFLWEVCGPEEFAFVTLVVERVEQGELPRGMVDRAFIWARRKQPYPFPYFQRGLRQLAAREGIEL